ncbi:hypothetical protein T484DRAFT_1839130 [Baffinella frigidus]|nr:hypothetical protein T484DRAFT_1839130 [Cryptophyta sp. CCMP2293]
MLLAKDAPEDPSGAPTYFLHSVIAHSGHSQVGHYVAYVRPAEENSDWFK